MDEQELLVNLRRVIRRGDTDSPDVAPVGTPTAQHRTMNEQLSRLRHAGATAAVGSGQQLAERCEELVRETAEHYLLLKTPAWAANSREVARLLSDFFRQTPSLSSVLWGHCLCWSGRAIQRYFYGGDSIGATPDLVPYAPKQKVGLRSNPLRPGVVIDPAQLHWAYPPGVLKADSRVQKLIHGDQMTYTPSGRDYASYRQSVGMTADPLSDAAWLRSRAFPALSGRIYNLFERSDDGRLLVALAGPGTSPQHKGVDTQLRLIAAGGILDVVLLKATRYYSRYGLPKHDDLCVAVVLSGEVVYISSGTGVLQGGTDNHLDWWVRRRLSRG